MSNGPYPMCVCYGPYHKPGLGPGSGGYTPTDIHNDMAIIAKYFKKIRTYAVDDANQWNVDIASQHGLQVCLGAKIDRIRTLRNLRSIRQYNKRTRGPARSNIS